MTKRTICDLNNRILNISLFGKRCDCWYFEEIKECYKVVTEHGVAIMHHNSFYSKIAEMVPGYKFVYFDYGMINDFDKKRRLIFSEIEFKYKMQIDKSLMKDLSYIIASSI